MILILIRQIIHISLFVKRICKTPSGLTLHLKACTRKAATKSSCINKSERLLTENVNINEKELCKENNTLTEETNTLTQVINDNELPTQSIYKWGNYDSHTFQKNVDFVYEKIVFWRKNLFLLPTGKSGKYMLMK